MRVFVLLGCLCLLVHCGKETIVVVPDCTPPSDSSMADVQHDATPDAEPDVTADAEPETTSDAEPDTTPDAEPDVQSDATPDAEPDTTPDAEPDVQSDATPDAEPDATPDAEPDVQSDATPDAEPDAQADVQADSQGSTPTAKRSIGYFPAWSIYARNYHVMDIPADKLTHINYAFANISPSGECVLGDPWADVDKTYPGDTWDQPLAGNFYQLLLLKEQHPHLKTLISIGGWTWSGNFSAVAMTEASRQQFVSSCLMFVTDYGFDGIDVDWEYPVGGGLNPGVPADKENYTLLMAEFRNQLNALTESTGKDYLLTIAAPAGPTTLENLEVVELAVILDWINLMTYDFHGGWDSKTNFNAALYPTTDDPAGGAAGRTLHEAVQTYLSLGVPSEKIVVGTAFYGRGWGGVPTTNNGLYQTASGTVPPGTWEAGVFDYSDLKANYVGQGDWVRSFHAEALVPWIYSASQQVFISYDDQESVQAKIDYVNEHQLGGMMNWELSADRDADLLNLMHSGLALP